MVGGKLGLIRIVVLPSKFKKWDKGVKAKCKGVIKMISHDIKLGKG